MKKLLLFLLSLLAGVTTWAQDWTAPSENDYPNSTPVYVQVNVNGEEQLKAQTAAFIDGECRAVSNAAETIVGDRQFHLLRVRGGDDDLSKTITFKVYWNGVVFNMTKTITFTGETYDAELPLVLNVDMPTGVSITNPLNIEMKLPGTYDLTNDVQLVYATASGATYTPLGESEFESELIYEWDFANSSSYFTVEGMTLSALQAGGGYLGLSVSTGDGLSFRGSTDVVITEPEVAVTDITCTPTEWTINIQDNLYELEDLNNAITILPEDATNKAYRFEAADDFAQAVFEGGKFTQGGTYNIKIVSEADESIYTTIVVTVIVPVERITVSTPSTLFYAAYDENIYELISPYVSVYPSDATDSGFHFEIPDEASDAIVDGVACQPGVYTIDIVADANDEIRLTVTVIINKIEAPESIAINVGESYLAELEGQITVLPELAESAFTYTVAPLNEHADAFDSEGVALTAGTYTLLVMCNENPKAMAQITVTVSTPVRIDFPSEITLSKFRDTEILLTLLEGDNYDPSLVELQFEIFTDIMVPSIPPIVYGVDNSSEGLRWVASANFVGYYQMAVLYNGEYMTNTDGTEWANVYVPIEVAFNNNGWDWIYYPGYFDLINEGGVYHDWMNVDENNRIIDLRSQTELLYNDPNYGLFGTINSLSQEEGMYKIKAKYEDEQDAIFVTSDKESVFWNSVTPAVVKGYNWIGYPNEWDISIDDFNSLVEVNPAVAGDAIIGKDGFAEYDGESGAWVAQDGFYLRAGKGYIYYSNSDAEKYIDFNVFPQEAEQAPSRNTVRKESVWKYNAGGFADNMAIVAEFAGLADPENYTIGAFVDGECRGEGSFVSGTKAMISVAGKSGENVSFRLFNHITGVYDDVAEVVRYGQKIGSLKKPLSLTVPSVTGISSVQTEIYGEVTGIYDLNGRRVESMSKSGVYLIKTLEDGKTVTKKIVKK